jgi:hypothetical protein
MRSLQRIAALATMWLVLWAVGVQLDEHSWAIWSILVLAVLLEYLAFQAGIEEGITIYLSLTPEQRREIDKMIEEDSND